MPSTTEVRAVVVGGGLAGLAAAFHLRDCEPLVVERESWIGGRTRSCRWMDDSWCNLGAHYLAGDESAVSWLAEQVGVSRHTVVHENTAMWVDGALIAGQGRYGRNSLTSLLTLVSGLFGLPKPEWDDITFQKLLGRKDLHPAFERYVGNTATANSWEISGYFGIMQMMLHNEHSPFREVMGNAHRISFAEGGTGELTRLLAASLSQPPVLEAEVTRVAREGNAVRVDFREATAERSLLADVCIVATPAPVTLSVIEDLSTEKAEALKDVEYGSFLGTAFFTNETKHMPWHDYYSVVVEGKSFSAIANNLTEVWHRTGKSVNGGTVRAYAAGPKASDIWSLSDAEVAAVMTRDFVDIFPEMEAVLEETSVFRWRYGIPYWKPGRLKALPLLQQPAGPIFFCGDYTDAAYMEGAARSGLRAGQEASQYLRAKLGNGPLRFNQ
ncbi:MAG: NAD(P)/FAD-dependent oxidoreductase [Dehalococcoidia bacterium]